MSVGFAGPYPDSLMSIAVERVVSQGGTDDYLLKAIIYDLFWIVYVAVAASNDGDGGLQTSDEPAVDFSEMSVASVNNNYNLDTDYLLIIAPDGTDIVYVPGSLYGGWKSIVNLTIVVNSYVVHIIYFCV